MAPTGFLAVGAPGVASQDCDEGHEVEEGGHNREDHLHHQEFEGEFDLKLPNIGVCGEKTIKIISSCPCVVRNKNNIS